MNDSEYLKHITQSINELLLGNYPEKQKSLPPELNGSEFGIELRKLNQSVNILFEKYRKAEQYILNLSKGNLDAEIPKSNQLISPFKELQANLRHLVWQTHRIAQGDYSQHIDFLGDFSSSYNNLISSLREKQELEEALSVNEEKYRMLAENVSDVIWKYDLASWHPTYISPSVFKLRGYTVEEAMAQSFQDTYTPEAGKYIQSVLTEQIRLLKQGDESARTCTIEAQQTCRDNSIIWVESVINFITDKKKKVVEILGVTRNIDNRKEAEAEMQKYARELSELNATKDKFFSIIAHDLRNPFNALLNISETIIENIQSNNKEKAIMLAVHLKESSQNTFELLKNLLGWAMIQQGGVRCEPANFILRPVVEDEVFTLNGISVQKKIRVTLEIRDNLEVKADKNMLKTILRNLITNALKYSNEGETVNISATKNREYTLISVKDSGIGMSREEVEQLFRISTGSSKPGTRNEKGTGLGLILCKEFTSLHSGEIWAESEPGLGSTFFLKLPL